LLCALPLTPSQTPHPHQHGSEQSHGSLNFKQPCPTRAKTSWHALKYGRTRLLVTWLCAIATRCLSYSPTPISRHAPRGNDTFQESMMPSTPTSLRPAQRLSILSFSRPSHRADTHPTKQMGVFKMPAAATPSQRATGCLQARLRCT